MTKTIVVPLDGSSLAERALGPAQWLGRGLGADVRLVRTSFSAQMDEEQDYLRRQAESVGASAADTQVIPNRFPASGILDVLDSQPDPALCMSTRGRSGLSALLLGSVSDEVLRSVHVPVVLLGPRWQPDVGEMTGTSGPRILVVSVDRSDPSFSVLPVAADWAQRLGFDVHLVTVAQCGDSAMDDQRVVAARQLVADAADRLRSLGVQAGQHVLNSAHTADVVVAFAMGRGAALIAIGTHGQSGLSARALGGVATDIVRQSPVPVLVRRPSA